MPLSFTVYEDGDVAKKVGNKYEFPRFGRGYFYEADSTALDELGEKRENEIISWSETIRVMEITYYRDCWHVI
jgi:hypothetical protein